MDQLLQPHVLLLLGLLAFLGLRHWLRAALARRRRPALILDGSNVMHWRDATPSLETLSEVVWHLTAKGYRVGVVFDANAGYLLSGRYLHDGALAQHLRLPVSRVMVVPKGTPADPVILDTARDMGARVVSNDRFRDWADAYPEVTAPGFLIRGGYGAKGPWLRLDETADQTFP